MQEKRRLELQSQMDQAIAAGDAALVEATRRIIDRETLECTAHTAERLKRVEADVAEIKSGLQAFREELTAQVKAIADAMAARRHWWEGAHWAFEIVKYLGAGGGGALLLRLAQIYARTQT